MSGGGKGSKQTTEIEIPEALKQGSKKLIDRGTRVAELGFQPNRAVTIAAFNPMQQSAFQNTANASSAFGLAAPANAMLGMPQPKMSAGGIVGYSTDAGYDEAMSKLPQGYKDAIANLFINPETGERPSWSAGSGESNSGGKGSGNRDDKPMMTFASKDGKPFIQSRGNIGGKGGTPNSQPSGGK